MADQGYWMNRPARPRLIERFADLPGVPLLRRRLLQIAARHVETHRVAVNVIERRFHGNVRAALADGNHQFYFVMIITGQWRVRHRRAVLDNHVAGFGEKERWRFFIMSHLTNVRQIVASYTINAVSYTHLRAHETGR